MTFTDFEIAFFVFGCVALVVAVIYGEFFDSAHTFRRNNRR